MYLVVIVLNKEEDLNAVLEKFNEIEITGATILDSKGMGRTLAEHNNFLVGGLRKLLQEKSRVGNKTLFAVVTSKNQAETTIEEVEKIIGDFSVPGRGIAFAFPLEIIKGVVLKN